MFDNPAWTQCTVGCTGSAISDGRCIRHLDEEQQAAQWAKLSAGNQWLDLRQAVFDGDLLARLLESVQRGEAGQYRLSRVRLDSAQFDASADFKDWIIEDVSFARARFNKVANFEGCTFGARTSFQDVTFVEGVNFNKTRCDGKISFSSTQFWDSARFAECALGEEVDFRSARFSKDCSFAKAVIGDAAQFSGVQFQGTADFSGARVGDGTSFLRAVFDSNVWFANTLFGDEVNFTGTRFGSGAQFTETTFGDMARFSQASFGHRCGFERAYFAGRVYLDNVTFGADFHFSDARVAGDSWWHWSHFGERAVFAGATFGQTVHFYGAQFAPDAELGPILATAPVILIGATLMRPRAVQLSAPQVIASRMALPNGARLQLRWAEADFTDCHFVAPTTISTLNMPAAADESAFLDMFPSEVVPGRERWRVRIVSLASSDLSNLVLMDVDLGACLFMHASNMDKVKLEGSTNFAPAPRSIGWRFPREVLAEEHEWRASRTHRIGGLRNRGWLPSNARTRWPRQDVTSLPRAAPITLSGMYRSLRKSREDTNNEPGAADFYYGEMEMRRLSAPVSAASGRF